jgi:hypothetical protein
MTAPDPPGAFRLGHDVAPLSVGSCGPVETAAGGFGHNIRSEQPAAPRPPTPYAGPTAAPFGHLPDEAVRQTSPRCRPPTCLPTRALPDGRLDEVAAHHGLTIAEVRRMRRRLPKGQDRPARPVYDHRAIVDLYCTGLTTEQVALQIGCSVKTVRRQVRRAGVGRVRRLDVDDIARRYQAGAVHDRDRGNDRVGHEAVSNAMQRARDPQATADGSLSGVRAPVV